MSIDTKHKVPALRFPGFRDTWEEKKLGSMGTFIGGGTPDTSVPEYWNGDIPWISSSDIEENNINLIRMERFINQEAIDESATKLVPKNSILFVSRVGIGKSAINSVKLCTSQDFINLTLTKDNSLFIGYLFQNKKNLLIRYSQGTSILIIITVLLVTASSIIRYKNRIVS